VTTSEMRALFNKHGFDDETIRLAEAGHTYWRENKFSDQPSVRKAHLEATPTFWNMNGSAMDLFLMVAKGIRAALATPSVASSQEPVRVKIRHGKHPETGEARLEQCVCGDDAHKPGCPWGVVNIAEHEMGRLAKEICEEVFAEELAVASPQDRKDVNDLCEAISRIRWARGTNKLDAAIFEAVRVQSIIDASHTAAPVGEPGRTPRDIAVSVGLAVYARMVRKAHDNNQVVKDGFLGNNQSYYVTLEQLESAFVDLRDEVSK
jgi:hypothetical protein